MIQLPCPNCENNRVEYFCTNENCQDKRLFCFDKCSKNQQKHIAHSKCTEKIEKIPDYFSERSKLCLEMEDKLDKMFQEVHSIFNEFKQQLSYKYSISEIILCQLDANQINNAIQNLVKFEKEQQNISKIFDQGITQFRQKLQECIYELHINEIDYQQIRPQEALIPSKPFEYQLINSDTNSKVPYLSFSFNHDSSLIGGGLLDGTIKIFEFKNEKLIENNNIEKKHNGAVYCLEFMKCSNQFISGSADKNAFIWSMDDKNQQWYCSKELKGHSSSIMCLSLDKQENQIFSGSNDFQIKIWDKRMNWECIQTLSDHRGIITSISLNPNQNILASCAQDDNQILIYIKKNQIWSIVQNIQVDIWGYRLCFIDNNTFTFQPNISNKLEIYGLTLQFNKINEIQVKNGLLCDVLFPQQFNRTKQILIDKNGTYINFIRIMPNNEFKLEQSIYFYNEQIYGSLSHDAQYLITWDENSHKVELRKYKEKVSS